MLKILPLCLILFLPMAYAELDHPTVCTITPDDPLINDNIKKQYLKETRDAVFEWQYKIQAVAKQPKNWTIDYQVDGKDCDVTIEFKRAYEDTSLSFHADILGMYENGKIELYFQEFSTCGSDGQSRCYYDDVIPARELGITAKHEFGHALGLGHADGGYDHLGAISIMNPQTNRINDLNQIRDIDVESVLFLYGQDGFNQKQFSVAEPTIPDWIKQTAKWWSNGMITDAEYIKSIEWLVNQGIIKLDK